MEPRIEIPEWIEKGQITIRLMELQPYATEVLIENLRDVTDQDDDRIRLLLRLWDALTAEGDEP